MDANNSRAVIDIGTHSVRMLVDGQGIRHQYATITRLGQGAGAGCLASEAILCTTDVIVEFTKIALWHGATPVLFATSAVREATNKQEIIQAVYDACQLPVKILSGEEEAELALAGATTDLPGKQICVLDIGGGSTEIVQGMDCHMDICASFPIGAVRLTDSAMSAQQMIEHTQETLANSQLTTDEATLWRGIGGTITSLAAMEMDLPPHDWEKAHGYSLPLSAVKEWVSRLEAMSPYERTQIPSLQPQRGKVILAGACVLLGVMLSMNIHRIEACTLDNLQGALRLMGKWKFST